MHYTSQDKSNKKLLFLAKEVDVTKVTPLKPSRNTLESRGHGKKLAYVPSGPTSDISEREQKEKQKMLKHFPDSELGALDILERERKEKWKSLKLAPGIEPGIEPGAPDILEKNWKENQNAYLLAQGIAPKERDEKKKTVYLELDDPCFERNIAPMPVSGNKAARPGAFHVKGIQAVDGQESMEDNILNADKEGSERSNKTTTGNITINVQGDDVLISAIAVDEEAEGIEREQELTEKIMKKLVKAEVVEPAPQKQKHVWIVVAILLCLFTIIGIVLGNTLPLSEKGMYETNTPEMTNPDELVWEQLGQDINRGGLGNQFGFSLASNQNGSVVAIGSRWGGFLEVFKLSNNGTDYIWEQLGNRIEDENHRELAYSIDINDDGTILAAGFSDEDANGNKTRSLRIFQLDVEFDGYRWNQIGDTLSSGPRSGKYCEPSISMNSGGNIVALGSYCDAAGSAGIVQVFQLDRSNERIFWKKKGQTLFGEVKNDGFGHGLSLSSDGTTIAITASRGAGRVDIFQLNSSSYWEPLGNPLYGVRNEDHFGHGLSLSGNGSIVLIGAPFTNATGEESGTVQVFHFSSGDWQQLGNDTNGEDEYQQASLEVGYVSLSDDGNVFAIGSQQNSVNGDNTGSVRLFEYDAIEGEWIQVGDTIYGTEKFAHFGNAVSLSRDGSKVVVGGLFRAGGSCNCHKSAGGATVYKRI